MTISSWPASKVTSSGISSCSASGVFNVYGAAADSVANYMHRGSRVGIDGRLDWREWETEDQQRRQAVSIVAETVQFLDSPGRDRAAGSDDALGEGAGDSGEELAGVGAKEGEISF